MAATSFLFPFFLSALAKFAWGRKGRARPMCVQRKDNAEVSGKILSEKRDQVAIDIGYPPWLVIPRSQIEKNPQRGLTPVVATHNKAHPNPQRARPSRPG